MLKKRIHRGRSVETTTKYFLLPTTKKKSNRNGTLSCVLLHALLFWVAKQTRASIAIIISFYSSSFHVQSIECILKWFSSMFGWTNGVNIWNILPSTYFVFDFESFAFVFFQYFSILCRFCRPFCQWNKVSTNGRWCAIKMCFACMMKIDFETLSLLCQTEHNSCSVFFLFCSFWNVWCHCGEVKR